MIPCSNYAQPLLDAMARDFAIAPAMIGLVVTLTQIGYGCCWCHWATCSTDVS